MSSVDYQESPGDSGASKSSMQTPQLSAIAVSAIFFTAAKNCDVS